MEYLIDIIKEELEKHNQKRIEIIPITTNISVIEKTIEEQTGNNNSKNKNGSFVRNYEMLQDFLQKDENCDSLRLIFVSKTYYHQFIVVGPRVQYDLNLQELGERIRDHARCGKSSKKFLFPVFAKHS